MLQKIAFVFFVSLTLLTFACKPQYGKPVSKISGDIVYNANGSEASITGEVMVLDHVNRPITDLGEIKDGKTELQFPTFSPEDNNPFYSEIDLGFPDIKIEPENTLWVPLNNSMRIVVFTDEEKPDTLSISNYKKPDSPKLKQNYVLDLKDASGNKVMFAYFTDNVVIKGKDTLSIAPYDVDIKASKGWNMIYVKQSGNTISMKTAEKDAGGFKWVAAKSNIDILFR
jgi:hypothetical protein